MEMWGNISSFCVCVCRETGSGSSQITPVSLMWPSVHRLKAQREGKFGLSPTTDKLVMHPFYYLFNF